MQLAILVAGIAFITSLLITPLIRRVAIHFNSFANRNERTIHAGQVPKLGGLGIFVGFLIGSCILFYKYGNQSEAYLGFFTGGVIVVFAGFLDDIFTLSCYKKLTFQIAGAVMAVFSGFVITSISLPFGTLELGWFSIPLSILWIVTITNAINLLDGLDGLASGFSVLLALLIIVAAGFTQDVVLASIALILITSTLGFLRYNLHPAKIFMGDTGSMFLGFCLACLAMKAFTFSTTTTHLGALFIPFSLPITDTLLAVTRRVSAGKHPFWADRKHIHHRLLDIGFNQSEAVLILYCVTAFFGIAGIILMFINVFYAILFLAAVFSIFIVALFQLDCFDFLHNKSLVSK